MRIELFMGHEDRIELLAGEHWAAKKGLISFEGTTSGYRSLIAYLKPGQKFMPHWHTDMEEIIHVVKGKGRLYLNELSREVIPGDTVYNTKYLAHTIETAGDETLAYLVFIFPCRDRKRSPLKLADHIRNKKYPVEVIDDFNVIYNTEELIPERARYFGELKISESSPLSTRWEEEAICYVVSGRGAVNMFGEKGELSPGSVLYLPPDAGVKWESTGADMSIICLRAEADRERLPEYYRELSSKY